MNKAFWSHFKHFGREIAVNNLSVPYSQQDWWRVPSQQGVPTTYNLTYWEASGQQTYVQTLLASLGVVIRKNSALQWGWGKGVDRKLGVTKVRNSPLQWVGWGVEGERGFWQIANSSYSWHQIPSSSSGRASSDSNTFLPKFSFAVFSVSTQGQIAFSKSPSLQKFVWRTDILRNRSIGCPCNHCW